MTIDPLIAAFADELTAWRRNIHANPELGFEEERTSRIVADRLKAFGCEVTTGIGKTDVVGSIRTLAPSDGVPSWMHSESCARCHIGTMLSSSRAVAPRGR